MGRTETQDETDITGIGLPAHLVSRVETRLPYTEFESSDEYVAFVLEEVLAHVEADADDESEPVSSEEVQRRLESLGYLDR